MNGHHDPLSPRSLVAAILVGLFVTIVGGVAVYRLTGPAAPSWVAGVVPMRSASFDSRANLESVMNAALSSEFGHKYRVVTDNDSGLSEYDFDNFVAPARKKFPYYPYIVIGDFDGDKVSDLAAEVRNTENGYERLAVLWGSSSKLTFYDGQLCSAISFLPANEWRSHWEEAAITLPADAIQVTCFEKSAWLLYWDGRAFQQYWLSD